jgi:molybdopterin-containing oxidoreductase family membrane subunit
MVLAIEYVPVILKNRKIRQISSMLVFEHELHKLIVVLAAVGTFLSFFHQGSLGGLYGVLIGRPFAFRPALGIWPTTFFLFIISAAAVGPSFILLTTALVSKISHKRLVAPEVYQLLGKISGSILIFYVLLKTIDTIIWINSTSPSLGFSAASFYKFSGFGTWIMFAEIVLCGLIPALIFLNQKMRMHFGWLITAALLACIGIVINRFVMTIQTLALPTLPFDQFLSYVPSWQEVATFLAVLAYGMLVYSISFRYLTLFPQERELESM